MKKYTLILFTTFIIFACESDDTESITTPENSDFLVSEVALGSNSSDYIYTYDASNKIIQMENSGLSSTANYTYNNSGVLLEIEHTPYLDQNNNTINKKITFLNVTENELLGRYEITNSSNPVPISWFLKYEFDGKLIKAFTMYDNDENDFRHKFVYTHDDDGKLLEIWQDDNMDDFAYVQTINSWEDNEFPNTNPSRRHEMLAYFPNHYASTRNYKSVTFKVVNLDSGHIASSSTFDHEYTYDVDGNTSNIKRTVTTNLGFTSTESFGTSINYIPSN